MVLTVPDFPACRPLIELQAAAKLLLYSANNSAGKNKNEFPLYSSCCSCRMYWQKFAPICPTGARGREGFLGSVPRMNALARLFTQSPGQSCLACRVCQWARKSGPSDLAAVTFLKSFFHSLLLYCCFILQGFDTNNDSCDIACIRAEPTLWNFRFWPLTRVLK